MESEQKRLLLALVLSGAVLFTWQTYFAPEKAPVIEGVQKIANESNQAVDDSKSSAPVSNKNVSKSTSIPPTVITLKNAGNEVVFNSSLKILKIQRDDIKENFDNTIGEDGELQIMLSSGGQLVPFNFNLSQSGNSVSGVDEAKGVVLDASLGQDGTLDWKVSSKEPVKIAFQIKSSPKNDASRQIRQFVDYGKEVKRSDVDDEETYEGLVKWLGVDYHYHLIANVFLNDVQSRVAVNNNTYTMRSTVAKREFSGFTTYLKKEYEGLQKVGHKLDLSIDYGIFGIIAVPILKGLKFFYSVIPNYGIAIILVTLLIRMLLFPLQFKSFKSMKKMQKLQPQLQKIKEKYKDEPQKVQKATMELFKKSGANPMSGCLPLILQMPVFFAMYQVFLHSVELLGAPFAFWITDLSMKDPYYVLPALMGASFFLQTKINPSTTADPTQQKVMLIMPLIFPFMMKDLPAGLNLYMSVSTLFGIAQQMIVYKVIDD